MTSRSSFQPKLCFDSMKNIGTRYQIRRKGTGIPQLVQGKKYFFNCFKKQLGLPIQEYTYIQKIYLLQSSFIFTGCTWIAMCDSLCLRLVRPSGFLMKPRSLQNSHYHISESFLSSISHRLEKMLLKDMFLFVFHSECIDLYLINHRNHKAGNSLGCSCSDFPVIHLVRWTLLLHPPRNSD